MVGARASESIDACFAWNRETFTVLPVAVSQRKISTSASSAEEQPFLWSSQASSRWPSVEKADENPPAGSTSTEVSPPLRS